MPERSGPDSSITRIHLVRHGRTAHTQTGWFDHRAVDEWRIAYDAAGLLAGEAPPAALHAIAARAGIVVASDLPRAVETAALLLPEGRIHHSPLLRETPLPIPALGGVRLPMSLWALAIGVTWLREMRRPEARARGEPWGRARGAAEWLESLADEHGTVLAVTHGAFRAYLATTLESRGWSRSPGRRRYHHWSSWELVR